MKPFTYSRASATDDALQQLARSPNTKFLGGGTNLVDLMRENIEQPDALVDVTGIANNQISESADGGLTIGAEATNTEVAEHALVRARFPLLAQAILFGASGQIRNMATVAGNMMQRTRCLYFYDRSMRCNKRAPGTGCDAVEGFHRMHAILGTSVHCIATHPSDMCVALAALDARVRVVRSHGERTIAFAEFHRLPGDTPHIDTNLQPDELITAVEIPPIDASSRSAYRKIRDRSSYAFALVSVAASVHIVDGKISDARLALGGVAHRPWRALAAEQLLKGAAPDTQSFERAADAELASAKALPQNAFKIELARRTIVDVLTELANRAS